MKIIILRGLPGSGKTTFIKQYISKLNLKEEDYVHLSADDYFTVNGKYFYEKNKVTSAQERCKFLCEEAMKAKINYIFIDNTNIRENWYSIYKNFAKQYSYNIEIISLYDAGLTPEELEVRNKHGVSAKLIKLLKLIYEIDNK